jgi:hypothetical protein
MIAITKLTSPPSPPQKHWVGYWHPPISLPLNSPFSYTNSPPHQWFFWTNFVAFFKKKGLKKIVFLVQIWLIFAKLLPNFWFQELEEKRKKKPGPHTTLFWCLIKVGFCGFWKFKRHGAHKRDHYEYPQLALFSFFIDFVLYNNNQLHKTTMQASHCHPLCMWNRAQWRVFNISHEASKWLHLT